LVTEANSATGGKSAPEVRRLQRFHTKSWPPGRRLADYALRLAKLRPAEVRFVILYESAAEGKDRRYSDWDVEVVRKKLLKPVGAVEDLYGMFNGRSVSGWVADSFSFKQRYIGVDDKLFVWRRRQLKKTRLLYGDAREFDRIVGKALSRR
jgi:predicted nucleotidyltransferase